MRALTIVGVLLILAGGWILVNGMSFTRSEQVAQRIGAAFGAWHTEFRGMTRRARGRFARREWMGGQEDAAAGPFRGEGTGADPLRVVDAAGEPPATGHEPATLHRPEPAAHRPGRNHKHFGTASEDLVLGCFGIAGDRHRLAEPRRPAPAGRGVASRQLADDVRPRPAHSPLAWLERSPMAAPAQAAFRRRP